MRRHRMLSIIFTAILVFVIAIPAVHAQTGSTCPALAQEAFTQIGNNCEGLARNRVCYGFDSVQATFAEETQFQQPADTADLTALQSIRTTAFALDEGTWGIAMMRLMANVPNTIPGQGVIFIMMGDATAKNMAPSGEALVFPEDPLQVAVALDNVSLVNFPPGFNRASEVIGTVSSGQELAADAVSLDGQWVRVAFTYEATATTQRANAWLRASALDTDADLSSLPTMGPDSHTPMQTFSLTTGVGQPACSAVPPSELVVQGPANIEVDITVNGLDVSIASTVVFQLNRDTDPPTLRIIPATGSAVIPNPLDPTGDPIVISATHFIDIPIVITLDENGDEVISISPAWITNFEQEKANFEQGLLEGRNILSEQQVNELATLRNLPAALLNYVPDTPEIIIPSGLGQPFPIFEGGQVPQD